MNTVHRSNIYSEFLLILYILGSLTFSILFSVIGITPPSWLRACLQYTLLFGLPSYFFMRYFGLTHASIRLIRPTSRRAILFTILLAFLIQPPLMLISNLSEMLFHNHTADSMQRLLSQPLPLLLLGSAVCPAVFEELACRGIFLTGYRKVSPVKAAVLNGIFFGILHLNMQQGLYAFLFGFVISLLCLATDSLWLPMLAHFLINAAQLITAYFGISLFPNMLVVIILSIISLPLIALLLRGLRQPALEVYENLTLESMKPFGITILIFLMSLFLL